MRVVIAGCGYVGSRLAEMLVEDGHTVYGLKRDPSTLPDGVEPVAADVADPSTLEDLPQADALVYAVSPTGRSEQEYRTAYIDGFRNVLDAAGPAVERVLLVTSTGVYGATDGRWVDEETEPDPNGATGRILVEAEAVLDEVDVPATSLRLGGIYGPGRTYTVRRVLNGEARCPAEGRYGNRIHRDDAAGALRHLLSLPELAPAYIGVDREPAELRDVYRWIAERGGVADPCASGERETWEAGGRRGTNKRCSSDRLAASGYSFTCPTYREGYGPIVDELRGG